MVVVFHHLGRGRGHATRHRLPAAIAGAHAVVVRALVPCGSQQWRHCCGQRRWWNRAAEQLLPHGRMLYIAIAALGRHQRRLPKRQVSLAVVLPPAYLFLITGQEVKHMLRHVFGLELAADTVAQNGLHAVVGADEDEAPFRGGEDVKLREWGLRRDILQSSDILHSMRLQPGLRHPTCHILRHGTCHSHHSSYKHREKHNSFFHIFII